MEANAPGVLQSFVDYLNDMLDKDHDAVRDMLNARGVVDPDGGLIEHSEANFYEDPETGELTIRLLGFLNGWILPEYGYVIRAIVDGEHDEDEYVTIHKFELMEWGEYQNQLTEANTKQIQGDSSD